MPLPAAALGASAVQTLRAGGYDYRNCTDYTAWKVTSLGVPVSKVTGLGNANTWDNNAPSKGLTVNATPAVGSVAVKETGAVGHVAYVEALMPGGKITISEYNYMLDGKFTIRTDTPANLGFSSFVHFEEFERISSLTSQVSSGIQNVYAGKSISSTQGANQAISWGGGSSLASWQVSTTGARVTSTSSQITPDGVTHQYVGTADGKILDVSWGNGALVTSWQVGTADSTVTGLSSQIIGGVQHVFASSASGKIYEMAWGNGTTLSGWQVTDLNNRITGISSQITPDGATHVYAGYATSVGGGVSDISWGNGASLTVWEVGSTDHLVTSVSSQLINGVQHVYASTTSGSLYEMAWGNGTTLSGWQVTSLNENVASISSVIVGGVQHVYAGTSSGFVKDISWGNGSPLTVWQVADFSGKPITSLSSQLTPDGVQHVYSGTGAGTSVGGNVYETAWGNSTSLSTWQPASF